MAPTFANLAPFWASRGRPKSAKIDQDRYFSIFRPKLAPRSSRTPSGPPFFKFGGHFLIVFLLFFKGFVYNLFFKFQSFRMFSSRFFFLERSSKRSRREGGGGIRPQGVFDNILSLLASQLAFAIVFGNLFSQLVVGPHNVGTTLAETKWPRAPDGSGQETNCENKWSRPTVKVNCESKPIR